MAGDGPNAARLRAQAATLDSICESYSTFHYSVSLLRKVAINGTKFSLPHDKHEQIFEQYSPLGVTRVVADAASIEDHIARACDVGEFPRKDPAEYMEANLLSSISIVASAIDNPAYTVQRRRAVAGIVKELAVLLEPLNSELRALAPWHVLRLPTVANVALIAALLKAMDWPDKLLAARMIFGSPTTGDLPPTNILRRKPRSAAFDAATFDLELPTKRRRAARR